MKYKVGDRVRIKGLDWYNANKNKNGYIDSIGEYPFSEEMQKFLGEHGVVVDLDEEDRSYSIYTSVNDSLDYYFCDYMLEDVAEESCEWCNVYLYYTEDGYTYPVENQKYCPVCARKLKND